MRLYLLALFTLCLSAFVQAVAEPGCDEDTLQAETMSAQLATYQGKRILILAGGVDPKAHQRVRGPIRRTGTYSEIWLCSGGGAVREGKKIGRELQRARAKVRIPDGYLCASSCTIMTLGGYLRIIEDGAEFIVHASSRVSRIAAGVRFEVSCSNSRFEQACPILSQEFQAQGLSQCSVTDFRNASASCSFIAPEDNRGRRAYRMRTEQLTQWRPSARTLQIVLDSHSTYAERGYLDLLQYYQEMLLDGQTALINRRAYNTLFDAYHSKSIQSRGTTERLNLEVTASTLARTNNILEERVVWQEALTQTELTAQEQFIAYLRPHAEKLGPAGPEALNIYEATITCRIQASCYLAGHQAAVLGYHNFNEDS